MGTIKASVNRKMKKDVVERAFGAWGPSKESGVRYARKIRDAEQVLKDKSARKRVLIKA